VELGQSLQIVLQLRFLLSEPLAAEQVEVVERQELLRVAAVVAQLGYVMLCFLQPVLWVVQ
jgi:hypothetical protein